MRTTSELRARDDDQTWSQCGPALNCRAVPVSLISLSAITAQLNGRNLDMIIQTFPSIVKKQTHVQGPGNAQNSTLSLQVINIISYNTYWLHSNLQICLIPVPPLMSSGRLHTIKVSKYTIQYRNTDIFQSISYRTSLSSELLSSFRMPSKPTLNTLAPEMLDMMFDAVYKSETGGKSYIKRAFFMHSIIFNGADAVVNDAMSINRVRGHIPSVEELELLEPARCLVQLQLVSKHFQKHIHSNFSSHIEKQKMLVAKVRYMLNSTQIQQILVSDSCETPMGELTVKKFKLLVSLTRIDGQEPRYQFKGKGNDVFDRNFNIIQRDK